MSEERPRDAKRKVIVFERREDTERREDRSALIAAGAGAAGALLGAATALAVQKPAAPLGEDILNNIYQLLVSISGKLDTISGQIEGLAERLSAELPTSVRTQGRYQVAVLADNIQARSGQKFRYLWGLPVRSFSIFLKVDGATDISLSLSPDAGNHIFDIGVVKIFTGPGSDAILVEHVCNYFEVATSNAVRITILAAGLT